MRLIDADAAKNEYWVLIKELTKATTEPLPDNALGAVAGYSIIDNAPTIDAVPVVRCHNCKYYDTDGCNDGFGWCEKSGRDHGSMDDHYCSDGEMKR